MSADGTIISDSQYGTVAESDVRKAGLPKTTPLQQVRGLGVSDARRLKALEGENARLKKLMAEQALVIEGLKEFSALFRPVTHELKACYFRWEIVGAQTAAAE